MRYPGNLRARLTSFVGREADLGTLRADLGRSRLVTLTGPGGSGKTRLAEEVAALGVSGPDTPYPDGAWLIELASLNHPTAVPGAVLSALGRRGTAVLTGTLEPTPPGARTAVAEPAHDATARLLEHCAHRRLLLVLDNCEHVIDAAAHLAETLLAHSPGLTVLATSREPLGVPGETVRPVEPLPPVPAHRLFADRAAAARAGFRTGSTSGSEVSSASEAHSASVSTSATDPAAVAEICRRLDGLPLAIELAAARLRSLTPRQIADRLDDRFRLLTSGSRTVLPRQQTLRAVVDWSWDLLDERERTVLRRLSVFSGGCTLTAAEYVCAGREETGGEATLDVLDVLGALVDKSILIAEQPPVGAETGVRYRMLETIHAYAKERAAEHPADRVAAEQRHTRQLLRFVTAAEPRLRSAEQLTWLPRLEADLDNIRAAVHRALQGADTDTLFGFVQAMGWFWWLRNYREEGAGWIQRTMALLPADRAERDDETEIRYRECQLLRLFLLAEREHCELFQDESYRLVARELLAVFRHPRPESARMPGLLWPFTAFLLMDLKSVGRLMDTSVATCRRFGHAWELAVALLFRAHIRVDLAGGLALAHADVAEIESLARPSGDRCSVRSADCAPRSTFSTAATPTPAGSTRRPSGTPSNWAPSPNCPSSSPASARSGIGRVTAARPRNWPGAPSRTATGSAWPTPAPTGPFCAPSSLWTTASRRAPAHCTPRPVT
ncbi:MAG: ATP-binding protein, partial [Streptomyces sp.]|uniref:ATP-binding protein n=1 Tax=Streptomyces sp. TaxID=1931 RepID=UPI003D6AEFF4